MPPIDSTGEYCAPQTNVITHCTCSMSDYAMGDELHHPRCSTSINEAAEITAEMPEGASFSSFVHQWEACGNVMSFNDIALIESDPARIGYLLGALLEEQRTANLIAVASSSAFSEAWRDRAIAHVVRQLQGQREMSPESSLCAGTGHDDLASDDDVPGETGIELGQRVHVQRDDAQLDAVEEVYVFEAYDSAAPEDANCTLVDPATGAWQLAGLAELARMTA